MYNVLRAVERHGGEFSSTYPTVLMSTNYLPMAMGLLTLARLNHNAESQ